MPDNEIRCPCGACLDDDPILCVRFRYPLPSDFQFEIPADEPCCCSCHEEYYRKIDEMEMEEEMGKDD